MKRKRKAVRGLRAVPAWARRGVLVFVLLAIVFAPLPGLASGQSSPACRGCRAQPASAERWASRLPGQWAAEAGATGTVPASGQAYVAVGGGLAAVGDGLTVEGYRLDDGAPLWQLELDAPAGSAIMSVRAWQGVVTAGIAGPSGTTRTEVVISSVTGTVLESYPAAVFGGAVAASPQATVVIGASSVTSYDNTTGKVRWRRQTGTAPAWRTDGNTLYIAESAGGYLGSAPVTGLQVIDLATGAERTLVSPLGQPFSGTLADAADGAVVFSSAAGVTAYSAATGAMLWTVADAVPEGTDPTAHLIYLTSSRGALLGVSPATGKVVASVSGSTATGSAGMYAVRGGVALGLDSGAGGDAWGYNVATGRVIWTTSGLPWPHYFSDLSGVGGSAAQTGNVVVIADCPRLAPATPATTPATTATPGGAGNPTASAGGQAGPGVSGTPTAASPTPTPSPSRPVQLCADPELVALNV